jgi:hypothetical protein
MSAARVPTPAVTGATPGHVETNPESFEIVDDTGIAMHIPIASVQPGLQFEGPLFAGSGTVGPPFPRDHYDGSVSLLGHHGFGPRPAGDDWWDAFGYPVKEAIWAAAWDGQEAVQRASDLQSLISLEDICTSAALRLSRTLRADGVRPARAVVWVPVRLLDVVAADTMTHDALLASHSHSGQYLDGRWDVKVLFPGEDHTMDRELMGRSLMDPEEMGVGGLMHLVLQASFERYSLDALLVVDSIHPGHAGDVDWPLEQRALDPEQFRSLISCPNGIVSCTQEGNMFRVTVTLKHDGASTVSWHEAPSHVKDRLAGIVGTPHHDTVRVSIYFSRSDSCEQGLMTAPCSLELHHDSARRGVLVRHMLSFDVLPFDKAAEFEHLSAQFAARSAENGTTSRTLCIVPASTGRAYENTAAISTPLADSEKAQLRYITHKYVACLLYAKPSASPREVRAAVRAARALF